jgi:2-dehydropantoate 2-reductase
MRIVIVGAGAMGSLFGFLFRRAGIDVWLLDKHPQLSNHIKEYGLRVEGISGDHRLSIPITTDAGEIGQTDLIIIFVKSYDTNQAISDARPLIGQRSVVLTLQNGIGNVEAIAKVAGAERTMAGTTAQGATMLGPGHIRHAGIGETIIGELNGNRTERLERIRDVLCSAGLDVKFTQDITGLLWSKLLINAGINPLTGITGLRNGQLTDYEETMKIMERVLVEAGKVISRKAIHLAYEDPISKVTSVCKATAANMSSMLQDLLNRKKTEINYINGVIAREGEQAGINTPINRALTHLIQFKERH